jgi:baculoviral IAP repeat-containing protein 6
MKTFQFGEISMFDIKGEYLHHYKSRINSESMSSNNSKLKRLIQEVGTLSNGLPLHFGSSVFLRVDEDRIDVMKAVITGPEGTPYQNGCFQFDIYCPSEYPKGNLFFKN